WMLLFIIGWLCQLRPAVASANEEEPARVGQGQTALPGHSGRLDNATEVAKREPLRIKLDFDAKGGKIGTSLLGEAAEIIRPEVDARQDTETLRLHNNVRLQLSDDSLTASADQAHIVICTDAKRTVQSVTISLTGCTSWVSGGLEAKADELAVTLRPDSN